MSSKLYRGLLFLSLPLAAHAQPGVSVSTLTAPAPPSGILTVVHPAEGVKLPALSQVFVFGAVTPGSTITINGTPIHAHPKGGYLTMIPVKAGDVLLSLEETTPKGDMLKLDRHFSIAPEFAVSPATPTTLVKESVSPADDLLLAPGDTLRVAFQGSPQGTAEFSIGGVAHNIPMLENGTQGLYQGTYLIQNTDAADRSVIEVTFKKGRDTLKVKANGRLTTDRSGIPRMGLITDDTVAARTGPEGGYDLFLYKGMRVRLSGKIGTNWRVRFSSQQSGWVKDSAIQLLPPGTPASQSMLTNLTITHQIDSTLIRAPLADVLPFRVEQTLEPPQLTVTLYGAVDKTDLIKYDPMDPLIRIVRWRQISQDTAQIIVQPKFKKWWGFDVRYEGNNLVIEVRKPWETNDLRGMVIAVDPGHGGSDSGAMGPLGTLEKEGNLEIARLVKKELETSGAKPFLIRDKDMDVPLYERPRIAARGGAKLFVSVHCNASGEAENPIWNNGYSVYWYQPQSQALAEAIHAGYAKHLPMLPDHGLYFADLAVCRMTQMPAVLTEQAFIIVPEQEQMILDPKFQKRFANAIVNGIKKFVATP